MPWVSNLAEEIAEEFSEVVYDGFGYGTSIHPNKFKLGLVFRDEDRSKLYEKERSGLSTRREQKRVNEKKRLADPTKRLKEIARKRKSRLKPHIEEWKTKAQLIVLGRDLPTERWFEILTNPLSKDEYEAFTDFAYFLRHKGVRKDYICSMLKCNAEELATALSGRVTDK